VLTSCPECATTFRVSQEQLGLRRGMVRCGRCTAVFNAYDNLRTEIELPSPDEVADGDWPGQAAPVPAPATGPAIRPAVPAVAAELVAAQRAPIVANALPDQSPDSAQDEMTDVALPAAARGEMHEAPTWMADLDADDDSAGQAPGAARRVFSESEDILLSDLPGVSPPRAGTQRGPRLLSGLAAFLLGLLLLVQVAYFLRSELVSLWPAARPLLQAACDGLGCNIPLGQDLEALRIEASSLETDPEQAAHARLHVTFSNRAEQRQDWPHFILKLSDVRNTAMAQRVFRPRDYLGADQSPARGMPARSEHEFSLDLDLGALSAAGYEIKPAYP